MAKKIPMRMCVGCRTMKEKRFLIRVVRGEDGVAHIDLTGKMNGRGAYICPDEQCLKMAVKSRALDRALEVKLTEEVAAQLAERIAQSGGDAGGQSI